MGGEVSPAHALSDGIGDLCEPRLTRNMRRPHTMSKGPLLVRTLG
jgi:hypothetical protein